MRRRGIQLSLVRLLTLLVFVVTSSRCWSQSVPDLPDRYRTDVAGQRAQPLFDPLGVRLGSLVARADGDVEIGYNSNLFGRASEVVADSYVKLAPSLRVDSDWGRHSIELSAGGDVTRYRSIASQDTEEYRLHAGGLFEVSDRLLLRSSLDYARDAEPRGTVGNRFTIGDPVYKRGLSSTIAAQLEGGAITSELLLAYRREHFEAVRIAGVATSQRERDTRGIGGRMTLLYRYSTAISALVQVVGDDSRNPDPDFCCTRNSRGFAVLGGLRLDNSGLVAGQIAVGYRHRSFTGTGTSSTGLTYDARLQWYPTDLLTVGLTADQQFRNSGLLSANAVLVNKQSLSVTYEMYRNLNLNLQLGREAASYRAVDARTQLKSVGLRATYTMRRLIQLSAFGQYLTTDTSRPTLASRYTAARAGISLRIRI